MRKNNGIQEKITIDEIKNWKKGETIIITAGTGAGKSYFIKNNLYDYAKANNQKILFLLHRLNCIKQFQDELDKDNKTDVIDIKSYQSIESKELKNYENDLSKYDYIVSDEFHYFISDADSKFNINTDLSLNKILNEKNAIKIFMSATSDYVSGYIKNYKKIETTEYNFPIDFNFIDKLEFFYQENELEYLIEKYIQENKKSIFFINSLSKATELYEKYKEHCLFNCSKGSKEYKYVDEDKINSMLNNCRFEETILITTTTMDAGVNIIDDEVKNIVIYKIKDWVVIQQCLGRKRLKLNEKIDVTVYAFHNKVLGSFKKYLNSELEMVNYLRKNGVIKYINKHSKDLDHSRIIYDIIDENNNPTKKINDLLMFKIQSSIAEIYQMLGFCPERENRDGFANFICQKFNYKKDLAFLEREKASKKLDEYLQGLLGKKLYNENEKEELINLINYRVDGKLLKSISKLNQKITMDKLNYTILSKKSGSKRFWSIEKV